MRDKPEECLKITSAGHMVKKSELSRRGYAQTLERAGSGNHLGARDHWYWQHSMFERFAAMSLQLPTIYIWEKPKGQKHDIKEKPDFTGFR